MLSKTIAYSEGLIHRFQSVRKLSERICAPLEVEDYVVQPIEDVSPPKWHLAHTTWFFETFLLQPFDKGYQLFNDQFPYLFNSYYVAAGDRWVRGQRGNLTRPSVKEIYRYRQYVDEAVTRFFDRSSEDWNEELKHIVDLGLQHEQQHQELLMYDIKYILGNNPLLPSYLEHALPAPPASSHSADPNWIDIPTGTYEIGWGDQGFCFDNELGRHSVYISEVQVSNQLVTNGEYVDFIEDGGYDRPELWLSEGWDWASQLTYKAPLYWHHIKDSYYSYTSYGLQALNHQEPVMHVSFFEADAFARWAGKELPTEFDWEIACQLAEPQIPTDANFAEGTKHVHSGTGHFYGNLWEWTASPYRPYPGYKAPSGALGEYNGKFMINQMVLRGGSFATSRDHIRYSYRNFFHPHLRWMFSGIRLASR